MKWRIQNRLSLLIEEARPQRHLIETLFSLVGIQVFVAGLSFVTTLMIANVLGREGFGDLSYAIAVGGYCSTIATCGLERTLIRDLVHFPKRFDEYTSASILLLGAMLVLALVGILVLDTVATRENRLGIAGVLIVLAMGINALYLAPIYDAWDKMKRHAVYSLVEKCLYFAGVWTLVFFFRDRLSILTISIFMLASIALGLTLQYRWALPRLNVRVDRKALSLAAAMLKRNLWVWSAVLGTLSLGGLSKIVLQHISGSEELGGYAVAWQVVTLASILTTQIGRMGNPRMARIVQGDVSHSRRVQFLLKYTALSTFAGAVIGVPAILFPTFILGILRPEYASAASSLRILGVVVIVVGIGQVATQYLIAVGKERVYAMVVVLTGGLSLILYYFFITRWSAPGAALAVLVSYGSAIMLSVIIIVGHLRNGAKRHGFPQDAVIAPLFDPDMETPTSR